MTANDILIELKTLGSEQTRKIFERHGARKPFYGVKVADLKKIVKKVKVNHELSLELFKSGNSDAMYLAGLICDPSKMSKTALQQWVENAYWYMLSEYTVAGAAAESNYGWLLAAEWINSEEEMIESAGWATYSHLLSIKPNEEIDYHLIKELLKKVGTSIHQSKNRVRYTKNGFIIAVGAYIPELKAEAVSIAQKIGKVSVFMGKTSCKVPIAKDYIEKIYDKGKGGQKRKRAIC
jgi:3-methyladenine DNA glycosylase AlkD